MGWLPACTAHEPTGLAEGNTGTRVDQVARREANQVAPDAESESSAHCRITHGDETRAKAELDGSDGSAI
jgi:hypothetical protein